MTQPKLPDDAIARGGPMDGRRLGHSDVQEFQVTMADLSRHRYARSDARDASGVLYDYTGRA